VKEQSGWRVGRNREIDVVHLALRLTPSGAAKSVEVLKELGPGIQWLHSYFTDNKVYCVYLAADENIILEHARRGGFLDSRPKRSLAPQVGLEPTTH
jgi:hypothetical protein